MGLYDSAPAINILAKITFLGVKLGIAEHIPTEQS
jgi:hypothetical protein